MRTSSHTSTRQKRLHLLQTNGLESSLAVSSLIQWAASAPRHQSRTRRSETQRDRSWRLIHPYLPVLRSILFPTAPPMAPWPRPRRVAAAAHLCARGGHMKYHSTRRFTSIAANMSSQGEGARRRRRRRRKAHARARWTVQMPLDSVNDQLESHMQTRCRRNALAPSPSPPRSCPDCRRRVRHLQCSHPSMSLRVPRLHLQSHHLLQAVAQPSHHS